MPSVGYSLNRELLNCTNTQMLSPQLLQFDCNLNRALLNCNLSRTGLTELFLKDYVKDLNVLNLIETLSDFAENLELN
jgi:hypothetical protein